MRDAFYSLLKQETPEFAEISPDAVLSACVNTQMMSDDGSCRPGGK